MLPICNIRSALKKQRGKETLKQPPEVSYMEQRLDIITFVVLSIGAIFEKKLQSLPFILLFE